MKPEQISYKVAQLKRPIYVQYKKDQNFIIVVLHIKTKLKTIYAFTFQFAPADFYYPNIVCSSTRYITNTELKKHLHNFLPQFLITFNDIEPANPIQTFYFSKDLPDFTHCKQTAEIQFNTNPRSKSFFEKYFAKSKVQTNYLINQNQK
jgi:hypothetical protein